MQQTICCIVASDEQLETLAADIRLFSATRVLIYPSFEIPPYTPLSPDPTTVAARLSTLYQLQDNTAPCIVLTSAEAVLRRILPKAALSTRCELVMAGEETDRDSLLAALTACGYQLCDMVRQQGDVAVRGGIMDIFPPAAANDYTSPIRLDFFGDTIESIRLFDPFSQRSKEELEEAILLPASDLLFPSAEEQTESWLAPLYEAAADLDWPVEQTRHLKQQLKANLRFPGIEFMLPLVYGQQSVQTLFDYLPDNATLVLQDPSAINQRVDLVRDRITANFEEATAQQVPALPPAQLFVTPEEISEALARLGQARLMVLPDPDQPDPPLQIQTGDHSLLGQEIELERKKRGLLAPLADRLKRWEQLGEITVLACRSAKQARHLSEMLANYQISTNQLPLPLALHSLPPTGEIQLVEHPLSRGFDLPHEKLHILSANELFGEKRLRSGRRKRRRSEGQPVQVEELAPGDLVVHRDHGVGCFQGLLNMEFAGQRGDFMLIGFRDDDKLYVPVDRLHWVSRYQGLTDQQPKLDSLGSQRWQTTKKRVTDAVWKVAQELLDIYARRALRRGHQFNPPGELFRELEESFPFDETTGQAEAIEDVLADMTGNQPMDRLVCGDVGYGKTEVAARAAFKAIEDGMQVAVLVPTTVLAEQHAATFRERFSSFPVEIACLNRFRTGRQQKEITADLSNGQLDLVVGTHRLLSKDIVFKKLGLLIVDEEHRFGVTHKEKIKKIKAQVDVLTLTATPIPRTLQMSLLGIRDLSVISTPPQQRRSVKTFLARHDQLVIREAVLRELQRGGQLFYVHNRVKSIHRIAATVESLVPQARIGVAHGQMPGQQLEDIMVRFINHEIDILICTTIIESGLDISNANTIIINRADHLGLADIYQLRGRVGRSSRQAFAYLLVPSLDSLTNDAKQRLRALMDNSELGAGFKLAMNDLQIRGGGNLLGVSQSGHIAAVGYDLYLELLQSTVADLKKKAAEGGSEEPDLDPEVKLQVAAFLPDTHIPDTAQRYQIYRRISLAGNGTEEELADLRDELIDRYGRMPEEAETLFVVIGLKQQLRPMGISKLEQGPDNLIFTFIENPPIDSQRLIGLVQQRSTGKKTAPPIRLTPDNRLIVPIAQQDPFTVIQSVLRSLQG